MWMNPVKNPREYSSRYSTGMFGAGDCKDQSQALEGSRVHSGARVLTRALVGLSFALALDPRGDVRPVLRTVVLVPTLYFNLSYGVHALSSLYPVG